MYNQPIDKSAKDIIKEDPYAKVKHNRKRLVQVYLVRFQSIRDPFYTFLKVGITNNLAKRFGEDMWKFQINCINTVSGFLRSEALEIERNIHKVLKEYKHQPKMHLLSGGNSECFDDKNEVIQTCLDLFGILKEELGKVHNK